MLPKERAKVKSTSSVNVDPLGIYEQHPDYKKRHMRFPTTAYLRTHAPRRVPFFAFEYGDTGAGADVGV